MFESKRSRRARIMGALLGALGTMALAAAVTPAAAMTELGSRGHHRHLAGASRVRYVASYPFGILNGRGCGYHLFRPNYSRYQRLKLRWPAHRRAVLPHFKIRQALSAQGFLHIRRLYFDRGSYVANAADIAGHQYKLYIDSYTGYVLCSGHGKR